MAHFPLLLRFSGLIFCSRFGYPFETEIYILASSLVQWIIKASLLLFWNGKIHFIFKDFLTSLELILSSLKISNSPNQISELASPSVNQILNCLYHSSKILLIFLRAVFAEIYFQKIILEIFERTLKVFFWKVISGIGLL